MSAPRTKGLIDNIALWNGGGQAHLGRRRVRTVYVHRRVDDFPAVNKVYASYSTALFRRGLCSGRQAAARRQGGEITSNRFDEGIGQVSNSNTSLGAFDCLIAIWYWSLDGSGIAGLQGFDPAQTEPPLGACSPGLGPCARDDRSDAGIPAWPPRFPPPPPGIPAPADTSFSRGSGCRDCGSESGCCARFADRWFFCFIAAAQCRSWTA